MIDFKPIRLSDKGWIDPLLAQSDWRGCEYNFTNLFCWKDAYCHEAARLGDSLLVRLCGALGCSYLYPAGGGDRKAAVLALKEEAGRRGEPLRLVCLTQGQVEELEGLFPGRFTFTADRDGYDYLYDIDRLADLGGKKLHAKRNHINRFLENNPSWTYEDITPESLPQCLEMDREWYRRSMVREGKAEISLKGKIRTILIPGKLCRKLEKYARQKKIASGELFLTRSGRPMSRKQIWAEMKGVCRAAGVAPSKVFPHNLRHLFARCFYRVSRDVAKLADVLGHSSIETTRIYLISTGAEHARTLEQLRLIC